VSAPRRTHETKETRTNVCIHTTKRPTDNRVTHSAGMSSTARGGRSFTRAATKKHQKQTEPACVGGCGAKSGALVGARASHPIRVPTPLPRPPFGLHYALACATGA
jgi:hypothetical protein